MTLLLTAATFWNRAAPRLLVWMFVLAAGLATTACAAPLPEPDPRTAPLAAQNPLYLDVNAPLDKRVADLVGRLTLAEKAQALNHNGPDIARIGLRGDKWNQCLNGVQWNKSTTLFPICTGLAATWNPDLVQNGVARVLSDEARAIYNGWHRDPAISDSHKGLIYRAPVINIERNPYWGRNYEAWGEDPFLTGRMGVAYVKGMQGDDPRHLKIATTLKHYAVNNVEADRMKLDAKVSERMLHEYWLPHFRDAVVEGNACSLMASYNAINGTPNNINHWLLTELLKDQWQHEGFVVSDLGGVHTMVQGHANQQMAYVDAVAKSLMAGCDFSDKEYEQYIPEAVRSGKLTEERLNDALTRVLRVRFRLGEFDPFEASPYARISPEVIDSAAHHAVALEAARQSLVLLQNRDDLLPLDAAKLKKLAVIGPFADRAITNGYNGRHDNIVTAWRGIREQVGNGVQVVHAAGARANNAPGARLDHEDGFSGGASVKLEAEAVGEFIEFPVEVPAAGTYRMVLQFKSFGNRATFQPSIDGEKLGAPVDMFGEPGRYEGTADIGAKALSRGVHAIRFTAAGKNRASGGFTGHFDKLTFTGDRAGDRKIEVELEKTKFVTGVDSGTGAVAEAAMLAKASDAVILCLGSDTGTEMEGRDRSFLGLPGTQQKLAEAVLAANPRTVVVLFGAGPLTVPWLKAHAPAMLQAWWPGHEGGTAVADALFGKVNPAGRLPHTVYAAEGQAPPIDEYDVSKGFTYMYVKGQPLYAFGHGLSYTTFAYENLRVSPTKDGKDGTITVQVDVKNSGRRAGDEVVQLYTRPVQPGVPRPAHELRGFQRVTLAPGETKTVTLTVPVEKLAFYDEKTHGFVVEPGDYEMQVGAASDDIRVRANVSVL